MIEGWGAGIRANSLLISPAYYYSQAAIVGVLSEPYAAFPAISPIIDTWPESGIYGNPAVAGYISYYASCPASTDVASTYVSSVSGWGAAYNTVQFKGSGVDCGP
jgi:hypothetical protein